MDIALLVNEAHHITMPMAFTGLRLMDISLFGNAKKDVRPRMLTEMDCKLISLCGQQLGEFLGVFALSCKVVIMSEGPICRQVHQLHAGNSLQIGFNAIVSDIGHFAHQAFQSCKCLHITYKERIQSSICEARCCT